MQVFATVGSHILADFWGCRFEILDNEDYIMKSLYQAAQAANMTILGEQRHKFQPQGFTGILLLSESHISIHTYPEDSYAAIDVFTCGSGMTEKAIAFLRKALNPVEVKEVNVTRGIPENESVSGMKCMSERVS